MPIGLAFQTVTAPVNRPANLYPDDVIADRMEHAREHIAKMSVEQAAEAAGMGSASSWYKKAAKVTPFKVAEIGTFAAAIGASPGWPFIEWGEAKLLKSRKE